MVKIRLRRLGAKKAPFYRVVVADSRFPRDGRFIEEIGTYNPLTDPVEIKIDSERAQQWIKNGAQPTDNFAGDKGLRVVKWSNLRSDGKPASDPSDPDTDVPLFRTAEAQLIVAETYFREGNKAEAVKAIASLQQMRNRKDLVTSAKLDADYLLDEWCREFYWEGRRRSDLRRFGKFTSSDYLWEWKGGVKEGRGVDDKYNTYPIPAQDYKDNPNYQGFGGTWYK